MAHPIQHSPHTHHTSRRTCVWTLALCKRSGVAPQTCSPSVGKAAAGGSRGRAASCSSSLGSFRFSQKIRAPAALGEDQVQYPAPQLGRGGGGRGVQSSSRESKAPSGVWGHLHSHGAGLLDARAHTHLRSTSGLQMCVCRWEHTHSWIPYTSI